MTAMDPDEALETCETALRQLMEHAYSTEFGADWLNHVSNAPQRKIWNQRAVDATSALRGVVSAPPVGLAYSQFKDLVTIANKFWDPLAEALGPKAETLPLLEWVERNRDTVAHHRHARVFQRDLISGIAGQIRNQVTIFMSSVDPGGDFYPRVEFAEDSFGNRIDPKVEGNEHHDGLCRASQVLHVGDTVAFDCTGTDPQDRALRWELSILGDGVGAEARSGEQITLQRQLKSAADIVECHLTLSSDGKHHRRFHYDAIVTFVYKVLPPVDR